MSALLVNAPRVPDRQPVTAEITALYQDGRPAQTPPRLSLFSDWSERKGDWRPRDTYRVEEIPTGIEGRAFLLHRPLEAVAEDGTERYGVLVARNDQDHLCECRGFEAHGRCKHLDALHWLLGAGHLYYRRCGP